MPMEQSSREEFNRAAKTAQKQINETEKKIGDAALFAQNEFVRTLEQISREAMACLFEIVLDARGASGFRESGTSAGGTPMVGGRADRCRASTARSAVTPTRMMPASARTAALR